MEIPCENKFCIYFENNHCIFDSVSLDELGTCTDMCSVDIDEAYLSYPFTEKKLLEKFKLLNAENT